MNVTILAAKYNSIIGNNASVVTLTKPTTNGRTYKKQAVQVQHGNSTQYYVPASDGGSRLFNATDYTVETPVALADAA